MTTRIPVIYKYKKIIDDIKKSNLFIITKLAENTNSEMLFFFKNVNSLYKWKYFSASKSIYAIKLLKKNIDKIIWKDFSQNSEDMAVDIIKENLDKVDWVNLALNKNNRAIDILKENKAKINWSSLSFNSCDSALDLLEENPEMINWSNLSLNESSRAINLLRKNIKRIDWSNLSSNENPDAIDLLSKNIANIDWEALCENPNPLAITLLEDNLDNVDWVSLSLNRGKEAVELLEENPEMIEWDLLCYNPYAIDLLKEKIRKDGFDELSIANLACNPAAMDIILENYEQIDAQEHTMMFHNIQTNPSLFDLDYKAMSKIRNRIIYLQIIEKALHPTRIQKWLDYHIKNTNGEYDFSEEFF